MALLWLALAGLVAGGLFWMRYASIFVPLAVGVYLLLERRLRRRLTWRHVGVFAGAAAGPVLALVIINRAFGAGSAQAQLNLGHAVGFHFTPGMIPRAWWNFTEFGFYDYHWYSHWVFALWPLALVAIALSIRPTRQALRAFAATPAVCMSGLLVVTLLAVLIGATTFFGDKFDYVALERYYQPLKPLYFVLFVAPILLIPRRVVRIGASVALLVAASWLVTQEWPRPYQRWLAADREAAPSGQWARCFTPDAAALYDWLGDQAGPNLIVVSNFHEYLTFETGIPALPIPQDVPTLDRWINRIATARNIANPRVLFVLDPDNKWRDYWLPQPNHVMKTFGLRDPIGATGAPVFEYPGANTSTAGLFGLDI